MIGVHCPHCNHRCRLGYSGEPATHWLADQRDPDPPHVHAPALAAECEECGGAKPISVRYHGDMPELRREE